MRRVVKGGCGDELEDDASNQGGPEEELPEEPPRSANAVKSRLPSAEVSNAVSAPSLTCGSSDSSSLIRSSSKESFSLSFCVRLFCFWGAKCQARNEMEKTCAYLVVVLALIGSVHFEANAADRPGPIAFLAPGLESTAKGMRGRITSFRFL